MQSVLAEQLFPSIPYPAIAIFSLVLILHVPERKGPISKNRTVSILHYIQDKGCLG